MNTPFRIFVTALLLAPLAALDAADMSKQKPNIIFILADDLGWGDLGCYGNLDIATPSLDRMATEGMMFEQFYVNASLCSPARAAMLTGRFPAELGIHYWMSPGHNRRMGMPDALDPMLANLPRTLQQAGYRTGHFGKWHVGEDKTVPVTAYGYDETDIVWQGVGPLLNRSPMLAIRDGDWKLLFNPDGSRVELYDIPRQPMELHSQAEAHPEVVARLREIALAWQKTLPEGPRTENPGSLDYPGYHEAPGRGPLLDRAKYEDLLQPVRVRLMRQRAPTKSAVIGEP